MISCGVVLSMIVQLLCTRCAVYDHQGISVMTGGKREREPEQDPHMHLLAQVQCGCSCVITALAIVVSIRH